VNSTAFVVIVSRFGDPDIGDTIPVEVADVRYRPARMPFLAAASELENVGGSMSEVDGFWQGISSEKEVGDSRFFVSALLQRIGRSNAVDALLKSAQKELPSDPNVATAKAKLRP